LLVAVEVVDKVEIILGVLVLAVLVVTELLLAQVVAVLPQSHH
jgi:hypothetical protein